MDFCIFEGFLYFKQPFCLHVCSCKVPHFVEASGCENHKSAPKKRGWVPDLGAPKSGLALQNGDTQPPYVIFWGITYIYMYVCNVMYVNVMQCNAM